MTALGKPVAALPADHPARRQGGASAPGFAAGASGDLYHALLPTVIGQRITAGEAVRQWASHPPARRAGTRSVPRPAATA